MHRKIFRTFLAMALTSATALAGSFNSSFSDPNQTGFTLNSNNALRPDGVTAFMPVVENGHLVLTYNENNEQGSIVLDDLDNGQTIESFTARFKLQLGPGTANAADGTAFCFGPDINSSSLFQEEGTGNGIIVVFDIYDNSGGEAPAVDIKYGGATIAHTMFTKADMVTGAFEDVSIQLTRNGMLNVGYKGKILYTNLVLPNFTPVAGQFAIGSRTGGENANQWIDDLNVQTVVAANTVKPSITTDPASQTVQEGSTVTFSVGYDGSAPLTFQWYKNNTPIEGSNGTTLTLTQVSYTDNLAKIKCSVDNTAGSATSKEATLTIVQDITPPTLVSVKGSADFLGAVLTFSEAITEASGGDKANFSIAGLTIDSATVLGGGSNVVLVTSKQSEGATYTVVANNIKDTSAKGNTIAANSQAQFKTFMFMSGAVLHKKYINVSDNTGSSPDNLFSDPRFPNNPDRMDLEPMWEYPSGGNGRVAADPARNYFDTLEGFFIPPTTGDYVFFTCGADRWWLYLSTDETPANKFMVAAEPAGWTNPRDWNLGQGTTDMSRSRTDLSTFNVWPEGSTISLVAGKRYYMLSIHHDPSWCGGDDFSATYKLASENDPVNASAPRLTGSVVGCYLDPTGSSVDFVKQPVDVALPEGGTAVFSVTATGTSTYGSSITYQWQKQAPGATTWVDIAGAVASSYTSPILTLADTGTKYRVACSVPAVTMPSTAATLTVNADKSAPVMVSAGAMQDQVGVKFDEAVDATSAGNLANYTIAGKTITAVKVSQDKKSVSLTVAGLTSGTSYDVTVKNIQDLHGNILTSAVQSFKPSAMKFAQVGAPATVGYAIPTGNNAWDLATAGRTMWGTYDEISFIYEEKTGDFDVAVRIESASPASTWARSGLMARAALDEGVAEGAGDGFSAYREVHSTPIDTLSFDTALSEFVVTSGAGFKGFEANQRNDKGGATTSLGNGGTVIYPNAWVRLQRAGDTFTRYYGTNGYSWTQLAQDTWAAPTTVYVGPHYSCEWGNISGWTNGPAGYVLTAKFSSYGVAKTNAANPALTGWSRSAGVITISYENGILQSAENIAGPWTDLNGASPANITIGTASAKKFYRVRSQ